MNELDTTSLTSLVQIIQSALTPAFLLTAIANLLNVFTTRLGRISDQVKIVESEVGDSTTNARLHSLRRRTRLLDIAVILGALAGACIASTVLVLFLGVLRSRAIVAPLFVLFGVSILCTIGALTAFLFEMLLASNHIRAEVDRKVAESESSA